jgi:hypothetical protein
LQECARMLLGKSIVKPQVFNRSLKCYRFTKEGRIEDLFVQESKPQERKASI